MLISNAYAKGDLPRWEGLIRRHLETIDASDADLAYAYSLLQAKAADWNSVLRWVEVSLAHQQTWTGEKKVARVAALHKMRSAALQDAYMKDYENSCASPSSASLETVEQRRLALLAAARAWLEASVESQAPALVALAEQPVNCAHGQRSGCFDDDCATSPCVLVNQAGGGQYWRSCPGQRCGCAE